MFRVFLVDDEELIVNQIAESLPWMDNGFEVIGVETDSQLALQRIIEIRPDVIFCDLKMPGFNGHALMKEVLKQEIDTEFVMLSAYGTFEDAKTFFQQDGFDYLLKPLRMEDAQLLLEKLAGKLTKKYPNRNEEIEVVKNPAFLELVEYIQNNYKERFTLEYLGHMFGLSAGYICNLFAKYYNTTLTCFITDIRMKKAVELIKNSNASLKVIAIECGYSNYFYFSKVFKEYYGVAPSKYTS